MIKLTAPNDETVEIDPRAITMIYANDGTYHHAAKTVLVVGGAHQAVKETVEEVQQKMGGS